MYLSPLRTAFDDRYLTKDPILFGGGDPGTYGILPRMETNLYGYTMQDPINFIDPSGTTLKDVRWSNVLGGGLLVTGGTVLVAGATGSVVGVAGTVVGAGAILQGGALLINEFVNFLKPPSLSLKTWSLNESLTTVSNVCR